LPAIHLFYFDALVVDVVSPGWFTRQGLVINGGEPAAGYQQR